MADARWLDDTEARAWRGYMQMTDLLRAQLARELQRDTGLSEPDYVVLVQLSEEPSRRMRMNDLAIRLQWSRSRLSHQLTRMEDRGLVRREGCATDARGSYAVLTPRGLRAIERAAPFHVESVRRHLIDLLDRDALEALAGISRTIVDHLSAIDATEEPCPGEA